MPVWLSAAWYSVVLGHVYNDTSLCRRWASPNVNHSLDSALNRAALTVGLHKLILCNGCLSQVWDIAGTSSVKYRVIRWCTHQWPLYVLYPSSRIHQKCIIATGKQHLLLYYAAILDEICWKPWNERHQQL